MSKADNPMSNDIAKALFWTYATIALSTWALASFLPLFGLFIKEQSYTVLIGQGLFLATGFLGVAGAYLTLRFLKGQKATQTHDGKSSKAGPVTIYATLWIVAYSIFAWI